MYSTDTTHNQLPSGRPTVNFAMELLHQQGHEEGKQPKAS